MTKRLYFRQPSSPKPTRRSPSPKARRDRWLRSTLLDLVAQGTPLTARQLAEETKGNPESVINAMSELYVEGKVQRRQVYNPTYRDSGVGQLNVYQYLPKGTVWPKLSPSEEPV